MDASCKHPVIAVVGPTASGKSALAIALAKRFDGEVISADSMQIYQGLDVGTAKVTEQEMDGIVHHGLNIRTPEQLFSVADFVGYAQQLEQQLYQRGKLPVVCGGTGLYVQSFLDGLQFSEEKADPQLRAALADELRQRGAQAMYDELYRVDPAAAQATHPNNTVRVLRALEHYRLTGRTLSEQKLRSVPPEQPYRSLILGLRFEDRAVLYRRIDQRVDRMMEQGLLEEAMLVWRCRERYHTAAQAIGYKEFFPYFEGQAPLAECVEKLKQASRNYAKRQLTWFRRMPQIHWLDAQDPQLQAQACAAAESFLQSR